ncbi:type 2 lanthipeptide synthetase LanM family protein [Kitasatospora sp. NPDC088134]|uniref:type 2 lanthipeptide synthetase LanM family protein n=1 Tax=Kitasatospora sp. NPDC088134 TaxID=3364071 RepID=UPI0037FD7EB8
MIDAGWWSAGVVAGEPDGSGGAGRPGWAGFVEAVLATVPDELPFTAVGFEDVVAPFARAAAGLLPAGDGGGTVELGSLRAEFVQRLTAVLARRSARTLVRELDAARERGDLAGRTPEERFRSFATATAGRAGLGALLAQYPVLARLLGQTCLHAAEALAELLAHFAADRAEIVATLLDGTDPGPLVTVETGAGDGHRRGRSVAVLGFADGRRVVHKPRPLRAHRHFNALVRWFNARPGTPDLPTLPVLALLDRDDYGWVEYIEAQSCSTARQLTTFYRRQGALLALLYALDGTDVHHENLIARGAEPFLVDVETLFHPPAAGLGADDPAGAALQSSVYRTGLLPHLQLGDRTALDASGLGGDAGAPLPADAAAWADPGTDRMRLVRRPRTLAGAANRPSLAGTAAEPADHLDALLDGFRAGYRAVADGRSELLDPQGPLARFADDEVRVVIRPTRTYATLLAESTRPEVLRDAASRDALFHLLGTDPAAGPGHPGTLEHEIAQLWDGDIPLFTTRPGSTDLWSGDGTRIPAALPRTGLARAAARLRALNDSDLTTQQWIVRATMTARATADPHTPPPQPQPALGTPLPGTGTGTAQLPGAAAAPPPPPDLSPARLLGAARRVGDLLLASGFDGGGRTNWLGLELLGDRHWQLRPCGADLGGGYTGVALFLARLATRTGEERYAAAAVRALAPLPALLERLAGRPADLAAVGPGGFAGLGGIAYAVTAVAAALDDPALSALVGPSVELTVRAAATESAPGLAEGLAGGLAALLAVHRATGSTAARDGARTLASRLLAAPPPPAAGFATGAAGVGWALLGWAEATEEIGETGETSETSETGAAEAGLAALRSAAHAPNRLDGWCRGRVGVALAVADRPSAARDPELAEFAERTARQVAARPGPLPEHSLCHGGTGGLELLTRWTAPDLRTARQRQAQHLVATIERDGRPRCGTPGAVPVPGLLVGLSGIGHTLLRLASPTQVPSVLLLQPPAPVHLRPGR